MYYNMYFLFQAQIESTVKTILSIWFFQNKPFYLRG